MSRSWKRALLLLAGAAVLAYGIFAIVQAKRQYDYVFLNNTYYAVTHEPARPEELGTQAVGTVRRYAQVPHPVLSSHADLLWRSLHQTKSLPP